MSHTDRRHFLQSCLGAAGAASLAGFAPDAIARAAKPREKLPVAAIVTDYHVNTHADVILGKILDGFDQLGGPGPDLKLAAVYTDQVPANDLSRTKSKQHGFKIAKTIEEAITLGAGKVAVSGVLNIGEHGNYPYTEDTHRHMYPRRRFFDGVADVFRKYKQVVPVFNDKHLAYNWPDAKHIYDTARELGVPFMAGSSVPVAWRVPPLTLPRGCEVGEAMALGYGGLESYGFHALEGLQCMVERRKGGETGVKSVRAVTGDDIWKAQREGLWSLDLLYAAAAASPAPNGRRPIGLTKNAVFFLIEYRDGLKATLAMHTGLSNEFCFAARLRDNPAPQATWFQLQEGKPYAHFGFLVKAVESMIHTGKPAYPVERTLLTTGVLDAGLHSLAEGVGKETPYLAIEYQPADWPFAKGRPAPPRENP